MDCTLATLVACFSWSGLYIDTGIAYQDQGEIHHFDVDKSEYIEKPGVIETASTQQHGVYDWKRNPYGRFGVGFDLNFRSVRWSLQATHTSSLATNDDRGMNAISLNARWYPFR